MAGWRFGRPWPEARLRRYLAELADQPINFSTPFEAMTAEHGWTVDGASDVIGHEPPGPPLPDGHFARARQALVNYDFSDPRIVVGHFDPRAPLLGRTMLLEIKVFGLRFLGGVRVQFVRDEATEDQSVFGFRYDTVQGHIERGCEWFLLCKDHHTGAISMSIEAHWRLGDFPTWWSRLGFLLLAEHFRSLWRRRAIARLKRLAVQPETVPVAAPRALAHRGDAEPQRTRAEGQSQ